MEKTIFKYELSTGGELIPEGKVLHVDFDKRTGKICAWVEHDKLYAGPAPQCFTKRNMKLFFVGTGWDFADDNFGSVIDTLEHLKTLITEDGYVWHVYKAFKG